MPTNVFVFHPVSDARIWGFSYDTTVTAFAVVSMRYVVLLDTLVNPASAQAMVEALRESLATRQLLVVNTHADWDHCWGNMVFAGSQATYPAPIIAHRLCRERLLSDDARTGLRDMQTSDSATYGAVELVPPTVVFDGTLLIDGGDLTLHLMPTPGHTVDHVSVWIPELRTLFAGDAAEAPLPFVPDAAALPALRMSLTWLRALGPATVLYCHAASTQPDVLAQNIAYFDELERRVRAAGVAGTTLLPDGEQLEALGGFPFDDVAGVEGLDDDERTFYRGAHQAAIRGMVG